MFAKIKIHKSLLRSLAIYAAIIMALSGCQSEEPEVFKRLPGERPPLAEEPLAAPNNPDAGSTTTQVTAMPVSAATDLKVGGNVLQVAGLAFTTSDDWVNEKPTSSMRAAQFKIPGDAGPAEASVFFFGANQGGGLEDNIRRWTAQFTTENATTTSQPAEVAKIEIEDLRLALVKTSGTYNLGMMGVPGVDSTPKPNFALFGLVVEGGPQGTVFVKVTGPKSTIDSQNAALEKFAQSVRISRYK